MKYALTTLSLSWLFACALDSTTPGNAPVLPPDEMVGTQVIPDIRCPELPDAGPTRAWRHSISAYIVEYYGSAHHRGIDLIAAAEDNTQTITGKLTYGPSDKDLQDEDVDVFACVGDVWHPLGTARTNSDGRIALALTGDARLPVGLRDLYMSVAGDRSGARLLGFVAPSGSALVVSDVDGTLTASENAYPTALALGGDTAVQPDAPAALMAAAAKGYNIVYITARGDRFTQDTRDWFAANGFPRGPIRMPSAIITMPGQDTVEYKTDALRSLAAFEIAAGIGNRASDIMAYGNAGVVPDRIFIKLPEFEGEVGADLAANKATGFPLYDLLRTQQIAEM